MNQQIQKIMEEIQEYHDTHGLLNGILKEESLVDFVNSNSQIIQKELGKALDTNFSGLVYPEKYKEVMSILKSFSRTPYPRQARLIASALEYLQDEKNLIISSEMGTGKTLMALSITATFLYQKKKGGNIALLCPSHLKLKWEEEIKKLLGGHIEVEVIQIKSGKEMLQYKNTEKPEHIRFFIFSKETAKLGYKLTEASSPALKIIFDDENNPIECKCAYCGGVYEYEEREKAREKTYRLLGKMLFKNIKPKHNDLLKAKHLTCPKCLLQSNAVQSNQNFLDALKHKKFLESADIRKISVAEAIRTFPKGYFEFLIADELHEYKGETGQGEAFMSISLHAKKTIGLTGTLLNGYASSLYFILFRMFPRLMTKELGLDFKKGLNKFIHNFGGFKSIFSQKEDLKRDKNGILIRKSAHHAGETRSEYAVINPKIIKVLLKHILFLRADEMNIALPDYTEEVIAVQPDKEVMKPYNDYIKELYYEIATHKRSNLLGAFCNHSLSILDNPAQPIEYHDKKAQRLYTYHPSVDSDFITNKDKELIELINKEQELGRKTLVYVTFVDGVLERLQHLLNKECPKLKIKALSSKIKAEDRQKWIENNPCDVLITNAELVKTGLDLFDYPTIIFYQTGYIVSTLKQASRRAWRIGQKHECKVYFLTYFATAQYEAIKLMSRKIKATNDLEGRLIVTSNELSSLAEEEEDGLQQALVNALMKQKPSDGEEEQISSKWTFVPREDDNFEKLYKQMPKITIEHFAKNNNLSNSASSETAPADNPPKQEIINMELHEDDYEAIGIKVVSKIDKKTKEVSLQLCFDF